MYIKIDQQIAPNVHTYISAQQSSAGSPSGRRDVCFVISSGSLGDASKRPVTKAHSTPTTVGLRKLKTFYWLGATPIVISPFCGIFKIL